MRVPRSNQVALAALLAGLVAAGPGRAASADPATVTLDAPAATSVASTPAQPAEPASAGKPAQPAADSTPSPAAAPAAENPPSDYKAPEATPASAPAPTAAAPAPAEPTEPTEPLPAAVYARLGDAAPLLTRLPAKEREAIRAFYAARNYKPAWIAEGAWNAAGKAVSNRLGAAAEDGLDVRAYPVPPLADRPDDKAAADAELRLSAAAVLYARDARGGRTNPSSISRLITPTLDLPAADAVLGKLSEGGAQAGDLLQAYNPASDGYRKLKAELALLRGPAPDKVKPLRLPQGPTLKTGMHDPRVPLLRSHFGLDARPGATVDLAAGEPDTYDATVAEAVAKFQKERGLPANGVLNIRTVLALADAGRPARSGEETELIVNMERWRWLPGDLGPDYVLVNVPEFRLRIFRGGTLRDETRVIVGKTESPTPIFSGLMEYAVVNPSWYVPPSILKTMAPKLASYGGKTFGNYEIVRHGGHISLRQPPGEKNALGFIKFMFPNQHAVYLHDTPNRSLFSASTRAFSHGCVRVDDPFRFADVVLPDWSEARLKKLIGKGERTIRLPQKLPVHLAYFTTVVDDGGSLRRVPDLYGYDAPMRAALGLPGGGGPAIAKLAKEAPRKAAAVVPPAPARHAAPPRSRHVATGRPSRRAFAEPDDDPFNPRHSMRSTGRPEYGEPGLWTPAPAPVTRSYW